jgi:glutamate racemase
MLENIDALVLACTHYPLIANEIDAFFNHNVHLLNSAKVVAEKLKWILEKENLISDCNKELKNEFLVSDLTENFVKSTQLFYGEALILKEQKL